MNKLYITLILFAFACAQHDTKGYTNLLKNQMVTIPKMDGITMDQVILLLIKILEFWKQSEEWAFFGIVQKNIKTSSLS